MLHMPRLSGQRGTWLVGLYATMQFVYAYWTHPRNPLLRVGIDAGWYDGGDQGGYLRIAQSFAQGELTRQMHYPPGYPILGVPFVTLTPLDPFVIPNLLIFVVTCILCFRLACQVLAPEVSLLALVLLSQDDQFLLAFVVPWNNIVPTLCLAVLLTFIVAPPRRTYLAAVGIGLCLAWTLAARYGDVLLLLPPALAALLRLAPTWRQRVVLATVAGLAAVPIVLWVGWVHYSISGSPFATPYVLHHSRITGYPSQDLTSRSLTYIGPHLFSLLVNALVFDQATQFTPVVPSIWHRSLLSYYFVVLFAGVGLAFMQRQQRWLAASFGASLALALVYYGSFWSTSPHDIKFFALRFLLPWQPLLVYAGVVGLVGLLQADWRSVANQRLVGVGLACTLVCMGGLYGLGRLMPPFPDWSRTIPPQGWAATASVAGGAATQVFDKTVGRGWWARGEQPVGASFTIDMRQLYLLDHLFLIRDVRSEAGPVAVQLTLSLDGLAWYTPPDLQVVTPEQRIIGFGFAPIEARYARFTLLAPSTAAGWAIDELVVYGDVPVVTALPGAQGWYGEEQVAAGQVRFRWLSAPASLTLQARAAQQVALTFKVVDAVREESTIELRANTGAVLMRFRVERGRRVLVGPLTARQGTTRLVLAVREGNADEPLTGAARQRRLVSLALAGVRAVPLGGAR